jgi:ankyrin repeat protein
MVYLASRQGHHTILRYLVSLPAVDLNSAADSKGSTPLHGACFGGSAPTVALLLACGVRYDIKNTFGNTAFDV